MAPEQAANTPVTPQTDVYGLGATLFHALTGRAPFEGDPFDAVARVQTTPAPRVRSIRPEVPVELDAIVQKCLEQDPADRYASATELADELDRFAAGEPVRAAPPTLVRRAVRAITRNRRRIAFGAFALLALPLAVLGGAAFNSRPRSEQTPATPTPLEQMQAKLAAGESVTLVGATGEPLWHRWVQGPSGFAPAGNRDQACMFQAFAVGMLDLCPDPMTDHYRIRAELCQLDVNGRTQDGRLPTGGIHDFGLYFGRQSLVGNNDWRAENCFVIQFGEVVKTPGPSPARFDRIAIVESPKRAASVSSWRLADVSLAPGRTLPGPWRVIEVEVTPQNVRAWIGSLDSAPTAFAEQSAAKLGKCFTERHSALDKLNPNHGLVSPAWTGRAPFGIWSYCSSVAIRNVTLTPLQ
jgi:hypothetical protein